MDHNRNQPPPPPVDPPPPYHQQPEAPFIISTVHIHRSNEQASDANGPAQSSSESPPLTDRETALETDMDTMKRQLTQLRADVDENTEDVAELNDGCGKMNKSFSKRMSSLEDTVEALNNCLRYTYCSRLVRVDLNFSRLQEQVEKMNAAVENVNCAVTELKREVVESRREVREHRRETFECKALLRTLLQFMRK